MQGKDARRAAPFNNNRKPKDQNYIILKWIFHNQKTAERILIKAEYLML